MSTVPTTPGFYWAKWMIADDHLPDLTPFKTWEVVEVYLADHYGDAVDNPDELRVYICGIDYSQGLDCFHWGERLEPPADKTDAIRDETRRREAAAAFKRWKEMTPDQREEFLAEQRRRNSG